MDLASGYSDSINYGNGYTPLATGAINNNNAEYQRNQMAMAMMAQAYNPYANSGGSFGAQPAYYAGLGRDYTTATGGNIYGGNSFSGWDPYAYGGSSGGIGSDAARAPTAASQALMLQNPAEYYRQYGVGGSGGGDPGAGNLPGDSFSDRFGNMPGQPYGPGYFDNTFGSVANTGGTSFAPYQGVQPMTPQQPIQQGGGFGSPGFGIGQQNYTGQPGFGLGIGTMGAPNPYASQPWWSTFEMTAGPQAAADWVRQQTGGASQNVGMSTQVRPDNREQNELMSGQRYRDATNTSPAIDPTQGYANLNPDTTPGWGYKPYNFPTAPAYEAPRTSFGSDEYPAIMYDKGEAGTNLRDPNMLNPFRDTWTNAS